MNGTPRGVEGFPCRESPRHLTMRYRMLIYSSGAVQRVLSPDGGQLLVAGINDAGVIVGTLDPGNTGPGFVGEQAFSYSNGSMTSLGDLQAFSSSSATAINDSGIAVGHSTSTDGNDQRPVMFVDGAVVDLGELPGDQYNNANAINSIGDVVGTAAPGNDSSLIHAFVWRAGEMADLNSLIPEGSGWTLATATGINDAGQIVGTGTDPSGQRRAFLLTPVIQSAGGGPAPHAVDDSMSTSEGVPVVINVLANDTDAGGTLDPASVTINSQPADGSLQVDPTTGNVTYSPAAGFVGADSFIYTVADVNGAVSNPATVQIGVNAGATGGPTTDLSPLVLTGQFVSNASGDGKTASGLIDFGTASQPMTLEVNGTVSYDANTIQATGSVLSLVGGLSSPLFDGSFTIPVGSAGTSALVDNGTGGQHITLAGEEVLFSDLTIGDGTITLHGSIALPSQLGGFSIPVTGSNQFQVDSNGLSLSLTASDQSLEVGGLDLDATSLSATYNTTADSLTLQGELELTIKDDDTITADLSGSNYIEISPSGVSLVGEISSSDDLDIDLVPGVLTLNSFDIAFDSVAQSFALHGSLQIGQVTVTGGGKIQDGELDEFDFNASGLDIDLPCGLVLDSIGGGIDHLAAADSAPLQISGEIGLSYGPQITVSLPDNLGGTFTAAVLDVDGSGSLDTAGNLSLAGKVSIVGDASEGTGLASGTISLKIDADTGTFDLPVSLEAFDNTVTFNGDLNGSSSGRIDGRGTGSVYILGVPVGSATLEFHYDAGPTTDDYFEGWTTLGIPGLSTTMGSRIDFAGDTTLLNAGDLPTVGAVDSVSPERIRSHNISSTAGQSFAVPAHAGAVVMGASWQNASMTNLQLQAPNGKIYSAGMGASLVGALSSPIQTLLLVSKPQAGTWKVLAPSDPNLGTVQYRGYAILAGPTVKVSAPSRPTESGSVLVRYKGTDGQPGATVSLFAGTDASGFSGAAIAGGLSPRSGSFLWQPTGLTDGDYHIFAEITDPASVPAFGYAPGSLIHGTPQLTASVRGAMPIAVTSGGKGHFTVTVANTGTGTATGNATINLYLSDDSTLDPTSDTFVQPTVVKGLRLKPGATKNIAVSVKFPNIARGKYFLVAAVASS